MVKGLIGYTYLKVIVAILSSSMLVCGKLRHECLSGVVEVPCETSKLRKPMGSCTAQCKCCCLCVTDSHNFEVACLKKKLILFVWCLSGSVLL